MSTSGNKDLSTIQEVIRPVLDAEVNEKLISIPSYDEVKDATIQIGAIKSQNPGYFLSTYVEVHWKRYNDIISLVQDFFRNCFHLKKINKTFVVLIPKKNNPQNANDFRHISLCMIYKIISKVLVNRLRETLDKIIRPYQCFC